MVRVTDDEGTDDSLLHVSLLKLAQGRETSSSTNFFLSLPLFNLTSAVPACKYIYETKHRSTRKIYYFLVAFALLLEFACHPFKQ